MLEKFNTYFKGDKIIWAVIFVLVLLSVLAVLSSISSLAYGEDGSNIAYYVFKHSSFLVIGLVIIYGLHHIPYKYFSRISQLLLFIAVPLLVITLFFGISKNDASRWIELPGTGFTFQTSDLAKLALIMYLARMLSLKQNKIKSYSEAFLPVVIPTLMVCALILPANFSTAAILFLTALILMFVGRIRTKYIIGLTTIIVVIISILLVIALKSDWEGRWGTWQNRLTSYSNPTDGDNNFQSDQSKIAVATGGLFGKGPGNSIRRNFLPQPYSDFIFAIIVEEYGLIGGIVVVFLYLYLLFRAGVIVRQSTRTFPAFLAFGLTIMLVLQAMVNMGVAVGIFPVTGQPLPLISMGGTSILFTSAAFGIILSVSRANTPPVKSETEDDGEEE